MKKGFTLAEMLITLGVISVIAALILPMTLKIKPDQTKVMYLKAYDTLSNLTKAMASNSRLYPICDNRAVAVYYGNHLLANTMKPAYDDDKYDNISGSKKYCQLLALNMGLTENDCSDGVGSLDITDSSIFGDKLSFVTTNGMLWTVAAQNSLTQTGTESFSVTYRNDVYVDVNGQKSPNCFYGDDCKNPDRFKFFVYSDGSVAAADPMGEHYISTRSSFTKKKTELTTTTYPDQDAALFSFQTPSCSIASTDNGSDNDFESCADMQSKLLALTSFEQELKASEDQTGAYAYADYSSLVNSAVSSHQAAGNCTTVTLEQVKQEIKTAHDNSATFMLH